MREIDPQSEGRITESLRQFAAASRRGAPETLGAGLLTAFRKHHARRRKIRRAGIGVLMLSLALIATIALRSSQQRPPAVGQSHEVSPVAPLVKTPETATVVTKAAIKTAATQAQPRRRVSKGAASVAQNRPFLALPGYDPAVPTDQLHVLRMQVPASALWQMGAPMSVNAGSRRMTADFVVSQDGTPYAVRLVQ